MIRMSPLLGVNGLSVSVGDKGILDGVSLAVSAGEIHFLMGPNGSGKSSLAYAIAGHPEYRITAGAVMLGGQDVTVMTPEERAAAGFFLSFQEPPEIGGVSMSIFLKTIAADGEAHSAAERAVALLPKLRLEPAFLSRLVNEGFSGGEKKKSELLQLAARRPRIAILDEADSGLDVDALASVAQFVRDHAAQGTGFLLISHSPPLLERIRPDRVHIMVGGRIAASGGAELVKLIEEKGYDAFASTRKH